jgi:hypothetical protein
MILEWFNTSAVEALADELARELVKRLPPSTIDSQNKKKMAIQIKTRDAVLRRVRDFASQHRLNIYKKARLANRFKWHLLEAGYSKPAVDDMAFQLAAIMATTKRAR